jgi:protein O-GlcNAc transferase
MNLTCGSGRLSRAEPTPLESAASRSMPFGRGNSAAAGTIAAEITVPERLNALFIQAMQLLHDSQPPRVQDAASLLTSLSKMNNGHHHLMANVCFWLGKCFWDSRLAHGEQGIPWYASQALEHYELSLQDRNKVPTEPESEWKLHKSRVYDEMARIHMAQTDFEASVSHFKLSLGEDQNNISAILGYGDLLFTAGRLAELADLYKHGLKHCKQDANYWHLYSSNLLIKNYICSGGHGSRGAGLWLSVRELFEEHTTWARLITEQMRQHKVSNHCNKKDPDRRLRIGYVSAHLDKPASCVYFFADGWFKGYDREKFHVTVYSNSDNTEIHQRRVIGDTVDELVLIFNKGTQAVVEKIVKDEIDILVDFCGHADNGRLDIFACQPAPVQVTWIAYPNSTGLECLHFRVADAYSDPLDSEQPFSEQLYRLPETFLCFTARSATPDVAPCPAIENGFVTFGSFNTIAKVQDECLDLWVTVIKSVPDSRLCLKAGTTFSFPSLREMWLKKLEERGIARNRILVLGYQPGVDGHLKAYNQIDIALDCFPYSGTTTTTEALLMGVPVVTIAAPTDSPVHASNVGCSLLNSVGTSDLIAKSSYDFVDIAVRLAEDDERRRALRGSLRSTLLRSPLGDTDRFRQNVQRMYQDMWRQYCLGIDWPPNKRS